MEFAKQLSRFSRIKVTVVVPEFHPFKALVSSLKMHSQVHGYHVVEAKKQPGFNDPLDWLMFPPEDLKTDIVVGIGTELGKAAQLWKKHYQCKSVCVETDYLYPSFYVRDNLEEPTIEIVTRHELWEAQHLAMLSRFNLVVATGRKMHEELSRDLLYDNKPVVNLTPGIISDLSDVPHGVGDATGGKFHVLFLGSDDPNHFEKEGFDIAAKAVAQNGKSCRLTYVGEVRNKSQLAKKFHQCGVAKTQLDFQSLPRGMEDWKRLLSRVDLAIMPSGLNAFGLEALFALSAGVPVLVHAESGFGEALKKVKFGKSAIVDSDDVAAWAEGIGKVKETDKKTRLEQATELRANYDETYNWEKQCGELVNMMVKMVSGMKSILFFFFFFSFIDLFISAGSEIQY